MIDNNPVAAKTFYGLVRRLSLNTSPIAPVVRYVIPPGETLDTAKVSIHVYGNAYETLAVMAAAGISHVDQEMKQGMAIRLPSPSQLSILKRVAGFESNPDLRENFSPTWAGDG